MGVRGPVAFVCISIRSSITSNSMGCVACGIIIGIGMPERE